MAAGGNNSPLMTFSEYEKSSDSKGTVEDKVEQHLTLVQNTKSRRGSFTSHAFPELHNKKAEPDTLLLLTRTRTDSRGRRHSVAVPLLPPPDGEKFAGGYQIQRNPITGGARLLPPTAKTKRGGVSPSRIIRHSSSECNVQKTPPLSSIEERSTVMTNAPSSCAKKQNVPGPATQTASPSSSSGGAIPRGRQGRRHSVQVTSLSKDMERLKLSERSQSNHAGGEKEKMSESRKKELRKMSQKRRSSKQSFLHFLDLAIAK